MIGIGTIVNAGAIVAGGLLGLTVGSLVPRLIFCVGWNILWNEKKIRVANLLPSLVVAIVWTLAKGGL